MIIALILIPLIAGVSAFALRNNYVRRTLLAATVVLHAALVIAVWFYSAPSACRGWFFLDQLGLLFLTTTTVLFNMASWYAIGYLAREGVTRKEDPVEGLLFYNGPEAVFTGCLLIFLGTMTMVIVAQHFGVLWVAMEATTLATAPLIYFHRHHRSLEATWKYLVICSVGIALALLGNVCLAVAGANLDHAFTVRELMRQHASLLVPWLKAAFLLFVVGYGTKMGLAPLHTWLPDAHSEAPSVVSALLSGALLNCAFLGIMRLYQICVECALGQFCRDVFIVLGLVSLGVAAIFILRQVDYKRMLAYSSIEHMGIIALGIGIGGAATFGALLHTINHSCAKAMLFLVAGNIIAVCRTKSIGTIQGLVRLAPWSGALWFAGGLAIVGCPPFGLFVSELMIARGAFETGQYAIGVSYLVLIAIVFACMMRLMLGMVFGVPAAGAAYEHREPVSAIIPPMLLGGIVLVLGVYLPPFLTNIIAQAAKGLF